MTVRCQSTGKVMHRSRRAAWHHLNYLAALHSRASVGMVAYRCPACRTWHVGHLPYAARIARITRRAPRRRRRRDGRGESAA